MMRIQQCVRLLVLLIGGLVVIQLLTTLQQHTSPHISDSKLTGRLSKAFFITEESERDTAGNWPNIIHLTSSIQRFLANHTNTTSSHKFPWNFQVKDNRNITCDKLYGNISSLSEHSVAIIIGTGDASLIQTLSSIMFVIQNSPPYLIKNILVVSDERFLEFEFEILEALLTPVPFFKTFRLPNFVADLEGRAFATSFTSANFLVMMDAKVLVSRGWLEPLVFEVTKDYRTVIVPSLILSENEGARDVERSILRRREIDWDLNIRLGFHPIKFSHFVTHIPQPAIYENLFLMSSKYFKEIGGFDHPRGASGAEAVLWSIKTWLCKGQILKSSCSRVFEIQNTVAPKHNQSNSKLIKHKQYIAQTFLGSDQYFYTCLVQDNPLNARIGIMRYYKANHFYKFSLKCDTFKTFKKRAQPELKSPSLKPEFYGRLKLVGSATYVSVDSKEPNKLILVTEDSQMSNEFSFKEFNFMHGGQCIDMESVNNTTKIVLTKCRKTNASKTWKYSNKRFMKRTDQRFCITNLPDDTGRTSGMLYLLKCSEHTSFNQFEFSLHYSRTCK